MGRLCEWTQSLAVKPGVSQNDELSNDATNLLPSENLEVCSFIYFLKLQGF